MSSLSFCDLQILIDAAKKVSLEPKLTPLQNNNQVLGLSYNGKTIASYTLKPNKQWKINFDSLQQKILADIKKLPKTNPSRMLLCSFSARITNLLVNKAR